MVLIDIEMPPRCFTCPANVGRWDGKWVCNISDRVVEEREEFARRPEWCPLKEVQE